MRWARWATSRRGSSRPSFAVEASEPLGNPAVNGAKSDRRSSRAAQQSREIEENQEALRRSIAETERLVSQSEDMLRRHRRERDEDEAAG